MPVKGFGFRSVGIGSTSNHFGVDMSVIGKRPPDPDPSESGNARVAWIWNLIAAIEKRDFLSCHSCVECVYDRSAFSAISFFEACAAADILVRSDPEDADEFGLYATPDVDLLRTGSGAERAYRRIKEAHDQWREWGSEELEGAVYLAAKTRLSGNEGRLDVGKTTIGWLRTLQASLVAELRAERLEPRRLASEAWQRARESVLAASRAKPLPALPGRQYAEDIGLFQEEFLRYASGSFVPGALTQPRSSEFVERWLPVAYDLSIQCFYSLLNEHGRPRAVAYARRSADGWRSHAGRAGSLQGSFELYAIGLGAYAAA